MFLHKNDHNNFFLAQVIEILVFHPSMAWKISAIEEILDQFLIFSHVLKLKERKHHRIETRLDNSIYYFVKALYE